jgi:hypothetical protein
VDVLKTWSEIPGLLMGCIQFFLLSILRQANITSVNEQGWGSATVCLVCHVDLQELGSLEGYLGKRVPMLRLSF